jgi:NTE family protein
VQLLRYSVIEPLLAYHGYKTTMHVVRLLAPSLDYEDHAKDIDFSPDGIRKRWAAGYSHTIETIANAPWRAAHEPGLGFYLYEAMGGNPVKTPAAA